MAWDRLAAHAEAPWCNDGVFKRYHGEGSQDLIRLYWNLEASQHVEGERLAFKPVALDGPVALSKRRREKGGGEEDSVEVESAEGKEKER